MKQSTNTETNKLVRWVNDGFPPIDLNEQVSHVKELVNENKRLADNNRELLECLNSYMDYHKQFYGSWLVALRPLTDQIETALKNAKK